MAQNGLLTREGEVTIAKRIEAGQLAMVRAAFSTPLALRWVLEVGEKVRTGELAVRELLRDEPEEDGEVVVDDGPQRRASSCRCVVSAASSPSAMRSSVG
jgi:RNA polymerase primary sigma factor